MLSFNNSSRLQRHLTFYSVAIKQCTTLYNKILCIFSAVCIYIFRVILALSIEYFSKNQFFNGDCEGLLWERDIF
jgi:hypothetical protein